MTLSGTAFQDSLDFIRMLADHWFSEWTDLGDWPWGSLESLAEYIDLFPLVVCVLWSLYGLNSLLRSFRRPRLPSVLPRYTVVIPFYAEAAGALRSVASLAGVSPGPDAIILVDDGSPTEMAPEPIPANTRLVRLRRNRGKAAALNAALREVHTDIVLCLDADTVIESRNLAPLLARFTQSNVGAVTGRLWPAQTRSLPRLMQALDYLAVIGLVKNAEEQWGGIMTVSGAWVAFRVEALRQLGGWNENSATEDIDLSWRLQEAGWRVVYERTVTARVEMVPTWRALWQQRRRWSQGLGRAVREHAAGALRAGATHFPVALVTLLSAAWLWACMVIGLVRLAVAAVQVAHGSNVFHEAVLNRMLVYGAICFGFFLVQLAIAALLDRTRGQLYPLFFLLAPLYPLYFLVISFTTFAVGFPEGLLRHDRGRWRRTVRSVELVTHAAPVEVQ